MCKGKKAGPVTATFQAGQEVMVRFDGSARHGGVLKTILGGLSVCFIL